jgi:hypothetical protein
MATLRTLTAQVKRLLSSGPQTRDSKLSDAYIQQEIVQVAHKLLKLSYFEEKNAGDHSISHHCIATYTGVAVVNDANRNRNYALLPARPMNLPGGMGLLEAKPETGDPHEDVAMVIIQPFELEMFRSLNVGLEVMSDQFCVELDRDRVWFTERNDETLLDAGIETVELKMPIIDLNQIDPDDTFPIGPDMEMDIIKEVCILHGYNPNAPVDNLNNLAPTK